MLAYIGDGQYANSIIYPVGPHGENLADPNPITPGSSGGYWNGVGQVLEGEGSALLGFLGGIGNAILHPIDTALGIGNALANPEQTIMALAGATVNTFNDLGSNDPQVAGKAVGNILIAAASIAAPLGEAAESAPTIGEIIGDAHPDSMIHLTIASEAQLAGGVDAGSIFVRYGDVSHMTLAEYQADVVGPFAAGSTSDARAFVVSQPGAAQFVPWYESGAAGVAEHAAVNPVMPFQYIPLF